MKEIPLSRGLTAIVDDEDVSLVSQFNWHVLKQVNGWRAVTNTPRRLKESPGSIYMHRLIMDAPNGMDVDHINGNGLDNRRANLRVCTRAENVRNCRKSHSNQSGYKGVYLKKNTRIWVSRLEHNGKVTATYHHSALDAARAYDQKAIETFGEFARLNFPEETK